MAWEPWACLSQCGEIEALTPARAAVRFTIPWRHTCRTCEPVYSESGCLTPLVCANMALTLLAL